MNRAERREKAIHMKKRASRLRLAFGSTDPRVIGKLARTRKQCDCWMCQLKRIRPHKSEPITIRYTLGERGRPLPYFDDDRSATP